MTAIFISHSSADNATAAEMKAWLEVQGHTSLFLDFDPEAGIKWASPGSSFPRRRESSLLLLDSGSRVARPE
ncbi:MAG TPA: hypothetical protein VKK81_13335 [Candidatus Binatia bacterium]|nr:hypothetical protein [Candidatus Binatia bacterium]